MDDPYAEEAVRIAKSVLAGSTPIFLACRQLSRPLIKLYVHEEEPFSIISAVSSKLYEFPTQEDRHLWNPDVVAKKDAELSAWLPQIQECVLDACREIVRRFGGGKE